MDIIDFGELTISLILLSAFSGFGILILSWIFRKKLFHKSKEDVIRCSIDQHRNEVQGDIAGGNIIKTTKFEKINTNIDRSKLLNRITLLAVIWQQEALSKEKIMTSDKKLIVHPGSDVNKEI